MDMCSRAVNQISRDDENRTLGHPHGMTVQQKYIVYKNICGDENPFLTSPSPIKDR